MKTWVKKDPPVIKVNVKKPLNEFCATDEKKNEFLTELLSNLNSLQFSTNTNSETLFFNYIKDGKDAFRINFDSQRLPNRQTFSANNLESSTTNSQTVFVLKTNEAIVSLQPRPPTSFKSNVARKLKNISRQICPRPPPFSIA